MPIQNPAYAPPPAPPVYFGGLTFEQTAPVLQALATFYGGPTLSSLPPPPGPLPGWGDLFPRWPAPGISFPEAVRQAGGQTAEGAYLVDVGTPSILPAEVVASLQVCWPTTALNPTTGTSEPFPQLGTINPSTGQVVDCSAGSIATFLALYDIYF